ncbi:cupin domain-containing protein [bacterium]|nr:cupin domain-containing protein [bacterium]MBU1883374.1 cupin domain-containing protein [bacterium]
MKEELQNIFKNKMFPKIGDELFDTILEHKNIKIELIRSNSIDHGTLYNQTHDEWVVVLEGEAVLEIDGTKHTLNVGDHLFIEANLPHRVIKTDERTLWLAIHIF